MVMKSRGVVDSSPELGQMIAWKEALGFSVSLALNFVKFGGLGIFFAEVLTEHWIDSGV